MITSPRVSPGAPIHISPEHYPWVNSATEVNSVMVEVEDEHRFQYASVIGLHSRIRKIADNVPEPTSLSTQAILFAGIGAVISGRRTSNISKLEGSDGLLPNGTLFTASNGIVQQPSLIFALRRDAELATVLKVGLSLPKDTPKLIQLLGVKQKGGSRRRM